MRLIEIHEQDWFPTHLRNQVTEALEFILRIGGIYRRAAARLGSAFRVCNTSRVVDLCSGGSGPWMWLHQSLQDHHAHPLEICLTDKYPNEAAFERIRQLTQGKVAYFPETVDATSVPAYLSGFRTIFSSFHHFPRHTAVSILQNAVDRREGIGIFEAARFHPLTILLTVCMLLGGFATAPFIRPFRLSRLFWTYLVPVIPLVLFFDGLVSCLRAYSPLELLEMISSLDADGYVWDVGQDSGGFATVTYLVGYPAEPSPGGVAGDALVAGAQNSAFSAAI